MNKLPLAYRIFRHLVFKVGDTKWLGFRHAPFVATWSVTEHQIDLNEVVLDAVPLVEPGDIILHRDEGYLGNVFIGGCMIHAGLVSHGQQLVEAISDGVVKRHVGHILYSDKACILRPKVCAATKDRAVQRAHKIVGFEYDPLFQFNAKEELDLVEKHGKKAMDQGVRFCCTEVPYFCYFEKAESLHVKLRRNVTLLTRFLSFIGVHPGASVVDADIYIAADFDLVWCSRSMTVEWCEDMAASPEVLAKVKEYWARKMSRTIPVPGKRIGFLRRTLARMLK
jgi:hypothetical protein